MRTARTEILALIVGVLFGVVLASCAAKPAQKSSATEPPTGRDTSGGAGGGEVKTLDDQIAHDLAQLGLDVPTENEIISASVSHSAPPFPMSSHVAETCESGGSAAGACSDVCTLADSICSNAHRICDLADELADDYSTQRCTSGKLSCERATGRCCDCE